MLSTGGQGDGQGGYSKIRNDYEETEYLLVHFKHNQLAVLI